MNGRPAIRLVGGRAVIGDPVQPTRSEAEIISVVPDGEYRARLVAVAPFSNAHGERMGFSFEIDSGPHSGIVLMQSAARSSSPVGRLAALLRDLLGREPTPAELRDGPGLEQIGLTCRIIAREGRRRSGTKYSAVERVMRI
jgi:hypothetical protein